jgi:hypothetical protein
MCNDTGQIAPAVRYRSINLIQLIQSRRKRQLELNEQLKTLWVDPAQRLMNVAEAESELLSSLKGVGLRGELGDK